MHDPHAGDLNPPKSPREREGPEAMQAFVARHRPLLILVAVVTAQLLLLSFQITRNHNVRLINIWVEAAFNPFERLVKNTDRLAMGAWRTYSGLRNAEKQNRELRTQLVSARAEIRDLSESAAEAQNLRTLLEFRARTPYPSMPAELISTSQGTNTDTVIIDKGQDYGLTSDLAVVTPDGIVGKTVAVYMHTAQVLLITDPSSGVGSVLEHNRTQGVLKGKRSGLCELEYVMNEESIARGEPVLTSGLDQIYPRGFPVGSVVAVGDGNIYKHITVKPAAALNRLESVLVILKPAVQEQAARNVPQKH